MEAVEEWMSDDDGGGGGPEDTETEPFSAEEAETPMTSLSVYVTLHRSVWHEQS